jgi:hypothetical protein
MARSPDGYMGTHFNSYMYMRAHTHRHTDARTHTHADRALGVYAQMPRCVSSYIAILQPRRCRFISKLLKEILFPSKTFCNGLLAVVTAGKLGFPR